MCACWKPCPSFVDHMKADARSQSDLARVTQPVASEQADTLPHIWLWLPAEQHNASVRALLSACCKLAILAGALHNDRVMGHWVQCKLCKLEVRMGLLDSVLYT